MDEHWTAQWNRAVRWRNRVARLRDEQWETFSSEAARDEFYALFQSVWHLKDWLKHDTSLPNDFTAGIEGIINAQGDLLLVAADICNGSKHLVVNPRQQRAGGSHLRGQDVHVRVGQRQGTSIAFRIRDERDGREWEAVELADRCLDIWRFLIPNFANYISDPV